MSRRNGLEDNCAGTCAGVPAVGGRACGDGSPLGTAGWVPPQLGGQWRLVGGLLRRSRRRRSPTPAGAFDGQDPLLARAGLAAVLVDVRGRTIWVQSARVDGPQTAPHAEVQAVLWVAEGSAGTVPVVTDCDLVTKRATALVADRGGAAIVEFHGGGRSDIWRRLAVCIPRVRWMPAHGDALGWTRREQALERLRVVHDVQR